ncbi:MAG TPA: hypothetical protein PLM60_04545 [Methanoregulaceae archaeon]|nr:hypothetical protein [Methanoregulaceae archaeon]HPS22658.1 hypothetical protein [Methanoregulaceae archaeon]
MAARKAKRCAYYQSRKRGKWTEMVCTLPSRGLCPNPRCQANPESLEPVPDAGE